MSCSLYPLRNKSKTTLTLLFLLFFGSIFQVILNPRQIAYHYLRSWFIIDLVSSIPMDYIFLLAGGQNRHFLEVSRALKILRFAKLLSLLRLLRLSRLMRFVSQWEQVRGQRSYLVTEATCV